MTLEPALLRRVWSNRQLRQRLADDEADSGGSGSPTGAAGGDLAGTYPNPTVPGVATEAARALAAEALLIPLTQRAAANGVATLDGAGKLPASQLTVDALEYKGTWNANTNSPALSNGSGSPGDFYIVSTGGSGGPVTAAAGDYVILNPSLVWEDIPVGATGRVASFNTRTGAVTLSKADVTGTGLAAADVGADASGSATAAQAAAIAASAQALIRTAVKTANYTAAAGDNVPCDISGGSFTVTLPTAPADRTRIAVKVVTISGTAGSTTLTIARGGSDVFNKAGGSTTLALTALFQGVVLQYDSGTSVWTVQSTDTPLGSALGAAQLGSDGKVGGPSGSGLAGSVANGVWPSNMRAVSSAPGSTAGGDVILANATTAGFAVPLPSAPAVGVLVTVKKTDGSANIVTVTPAGAGTIDGDPTAAITSPQFGAVFEHIGSDVWKIVGVTSAGGSNGTNGNTVRSGSGVPSGGLGTDGDFYIDTAASNIYGPKAAGAWGAGTSLKGTAGAISQIQDEGSNLAVRGTLDFVGAGVTATDDSGNGRTLITIPAQGNVARGRPIPSGGSTYYTVPGGNPAATGSVTQSSGRIMYEPILVTTDITLDQLAIVCTAAVAACTGRLAIYTADVNWQPVALVIEPTSVTQLDLSATGTKTTPCAQVLTAGRYLLTSNVSTGNPIFSAALCPHEWTGLNLPGGATLNLPASWYVASAYAAFSATPVAWTTITLANTGFQHSIFARVSVP